VIEPVGAFLTLLELFIAFTTVFEDVVFEPVSATVIGAFDKVPVSPQTVIGRVAPVELA